MAFAFPTVQDPLPGQSQTIAPLKFQIVAQYWAIGVFLVTFAGTFFYNVFLVRDDIKDAFARVKTKLRGETKQREKRRD